MLRSMSETQPSRSDGTIHSRRNRAVLFVAAVTVLLLTTGCSKSGSTTAQPSGAPKRLSQQAAQVEYETAKARLALPPGAVAFPVAIPTPQEATEYEQGYATSLAERYWICAWEKEWLGQRSTDGTRAEAALIQLGKAPDTEFMSQHLDDAGRRFFNDYLTKAGLGDPSGIQQDVAQNCSS